MARRALAVSILILCSSGCSTLRKLSHVESRSPANARGDLNVSPVRDRVIKQSVFSKSCPADVSNLLPQLAEERVKFPPCPEKLQQAFADAKELLRMDERSTVEELISSECHSLSGGANEESIESLVQGIDPSLRNPGKHGDAEKSAWTEEEIRKRALLRESLAEVRNVNEPLDQWIKINGEYAIPEDQLEFLDDLVIGKGCRLTNQAVDQTYRMIHSLEELVRIQPEADKQRVRVEKLLRGIHVVIDRKIQEYFRP